MEPVEIPYLQPFTDRHGKERCYFRRRGYPTVALPGRPGSPEFLAAYADAAAWREPDAKPVRSRSITALCVSYYTTDERYLALAPETKHNYRRMLDRFRDEFGDLLVGTVRPRHIKRIIAGRPANLRKRLAQLFDHAVELEWIHANPVRAIKARRHTGPGFREWLDEDIAQFEAAYPSGSRERLALALLLCTGQRRSDVSGMGRQHLRGERLHVVQFKGRRRSPTRLAIPIHPTLRIELDLVPSNQLTFVQTAYGKPFSHAGFTGWFTKAAEKAGLPKGSTPHGLRKAAGRRLAEAGCTTRQIMAILGHRTMKEAEHYTSGVDQVRLADQAMATLQEHRMSNPAVKP